MRKDLVCQRVKSRLTIISCHQAVSLCLLRAEYGGNVEFHLTDVLFDELP